MTTINDDMDATQTTIPLADPAALAVGYYTIDDENVQVLGIERRTEVGDKWTRIGGRHDKDADEPTSVHCIRGVGGSTAATHDEGATLTRYYPDAPGPDVETATPGPVGLFAEVKDPVRLAAVQAYPFGGNIGDSGDGVSLVYDNGPDDDGIGATVTAFAAAALKIDGVTPEVGDRVVLVDSFDQGPLVFGIYTVTDLGADDPEGSPWVLTRATDCDTTDDIRKLWYTVPSEGFAYAGATVGVFSYNPAVEIGDTTTVEPFVQPLTTTAIGRSAIALAGVSESGLFTPVAVGSPVDVIAMGAGAVADSDSVAIGASAKATGVGSVAIGLSAVAANDAAAIGPSSSATAEQAVSIGYGTTNAAAGVTKVDGPNGSLVILKAPGGAKYYLAVSDVGALTAEPVV